MKTKIVISALLLALLAGCSSKGDRVRAERTSADADRSDSTQGVGDRDRSSAEPLPMSAEERKRKEQERLAQNNTVYFDYDSADLSSEARATVVKHADFLTQNPNVQVRLEGHTDERGTREYNIGLGERRAQSVARVLQSRGVSGTQIEVISYGEERPAELGSNESAWAKNRRVEIVYR